VIILDKMRIKMRMKLKMSSLVKTDTLKVTIRIRLNKQGILKIQIMILNRMRAVK